MENKYCLENINRIQSGGVVRGRVSKEGEFVNVWIFTSYTVQLPLNYKFGFEFPDDQVKKGKPLRDTIDINYIDFEQRVS